MKQRLVLNTIMFFAYPHSGAKAICSILRNVVAQASSVRSVSAGPSRASVLLPLAFGRNRRSAETFTKEVLLFRFVFAPRTSVCSVWRLVGAEMANDLFVDCRSSGGKRSAAVGSTQDREGNDRGDKVKKLVGLPTVLALLAAVAPPRSAANVSSS